MLDAMYENGVITMEIKFIVNPQVKESSELVEIEYSHYPYKNRCF